MSTPWDAHAYDVSSQPQQAWAVDVLERLKGIAPDATVLDVGCGTGRVTEQLLELVPRGRVLAFDASPAMIELARARLGDRAELWCQDVLSLELPELVDVVVSNAVLHWVTDHPRMWRALGAALRPGGRLEIQCGGMGNISRVREVIDRLATDAFPELVGWSPWEFAAPEVTDSVCGTRLHQDSLLAAEPADLSRRRRAVHPHLDPGRPPRAPARAAA